MQQPKGHRPDIKEHLMSRSIRSNVLVRSLYALALLGLLLGGSLAARAEPGGFQPPAPTAAQQTVYLPLIARPGTASGGASSDELIDAALKRGELDAETALIYHVFSACFDPRLPTKYHGDDSKPSEREVVGEVIERFSQLSPQAKATLEPFTIPPYHTGSWWDLRQNHALATTSAIAPAELRCGQTG